MRLTVSYVFLLTVCLLCTSHASTELEEGPECPGIIPPFARKRGEYGQVSSLARPHHTSTSQDERDFIPYKILYLLDETVSSDTKSRFDPIFEKVNERLSRVVRGRKVKDVRIKESWYTDGPCDLCDNDTIVFPEEFVARHRRCANMTNVTSGPPSERVNELNTHNYTLVVRVLVRWEGEGAKLATHGCASTTLAYARQCSLDDPSYGVDHGTMMYCNKILNKTDEQVVSTSLHETMHILAPTLVVHYPLAEECETIEHCENRIWKNITRTVLNKTGQQVHRYSYLATIDELRDAAQAYFDCPSAQGLELNSKWSNKLSIYEPDYGHWSERLFPDELMAPKGHDSQRLSNLTLSVLAAYRDWYRVDMSKAEPLFHKITNGCDQLEKGCHAVVLEQRQNQQPTFFQPYCDRMEGQGRAITTHCSSDHKIQLRCHEMDSANNECTSLIAFSQMYDHEACETATKYKSDFASGIGATFGAHTICVTLTTTPPTWKWPHLSIPVCVQYECARNEKRLVLKFQPKVELGSMCFVNCSADEAKRIVGGPKDTSCGNVSSISLICPDYSTICDPPTTTTSTSSSTSIISPPSITRSTSTTITSAATQEPGESNSDRGGTPAMSTLPPIVSSAIRSVLECLMFPWISAVITWLAR